MPIKEMVKYDNYLNSINFKGLKASELDVIIALCAKMKGHENERVVFTYNELKEIIFLRKVTDEELRNKIKTAAKKLGDVNGEIQLPNGAIVYFDLFPTRVDNPEERTFSIRVNEDVLFILNNLTKNFTLFELREFIQLSSKYSKHLYRLLKQFRTTGIFKINTDDLKQYLDIPETYANKRIKYEILNPAIEELKSYFKNLKIEPKIAKKRGSPVIGYTFTFEPEQIKEKPIINGVLGQKATQQLKTQDKVQYTSKPVNHRFNQFPQRDYTKDDYKNLEKRLLKKSIGNKSEQEQEEEREGMRKFREKYPNLYR